MNWKEVTVKTDISVSEAVIDIIRELGARGVVILEEKQKLGITAYYPDNNDFNHVLQTLKRKINRLTDFGFDVKEVQITVRSQPHQDWTTSWQNFFKPIKVGSKFLICPQWEKCRDRDRIVIEIDPGRAFGTGNHESTKLCLLFIEKYLYSTYNKQNNKKIKKMLDVGAGSGILSIAAARLGVSQITSIEKDVEACKILKKNIKINNAADQIVVIQKDFEKGIGHTFPLVVANLLSVIIKNLLPQLSAHVSSGGLLILSGIMQENRAGIVSHLAENDLNLIDEKVMGDWIGLAARKG